MKGFDSAADVSVTPVLAPHRIAATYSLNLGVQTSSNERVLTGLSNSDFEPAMAPSDGPRASRTTLSKVIADDKLLQDPTGLRLDQQSRQRHRRAEIQTKRPNFDQQGQRRSKRISTL